MNQLNQDNPKKIAVIGFHGRFPDAENPGELWKNLCEDKLSITHVPETRWIDNQTSTKSLNRNWGGFMTGVDMFDTELFYITPHEANEMDPQQRLLLESVWTTLEDAGYGNHRRDPKYEIGLFVGSMWNDYQLLSHEYGFLKDQYKGPGSLSWSIANRTSFTLNLKGPSMTVDTACSSSLLAVHLACQSLLIEECELAVAGGVNLILHPNRYVFQAKEGMMSHEMEKTIFTPGSEGYVPGEGVGTILLKPLNKAMADKDHIYATIIASGTSHNGSGIFFKLPDANAQKRLLQGVYEKAGIDPKTINHIEISAYGSEAVDFEEYLGLSKVFKNIYENKKYCTLGTPKPNIGHLEAASGITQLIKVLLQLHHEKILPSRFNRAIPEEFEFDKSPFYLPDKLHDWMPTQNHDHGDSNPIPRRAGVNSFGAGGTNVHLVMEEYLLNQEENPGKEASKTETLIVLSANHNVTLKKYANKLKKYIKNEKSPINLRDMACTYQLGRESMKKRVAFLIHSVEDLAQLITSFLGDKKNKNRTFYGSNEKVEKDESIDAAWIKKANLKDIATKWVEGQNIDWEVLYKNFRARKIPIPTYPFSRRRYWITNGNREGTDFQKYKKPGNKVKELYSESMKNKALIYFKTLMSEKLHVDAEQIDENAPISKFGISSLMIKRLNLELEREFGTLPKTLFFEYQTVEKLVDYFFRNRRSRLNEILKAGRNNSEPNVNNPDLDKVHSIKHNFPLYALSDRKYDQNNHKHKSKEIAIIGLSGRYPMADNLDEFWHNLSLKKDCITVIPEERWDYKLWYDPDHEKPQSTYSKWGGFVSDVDRFDPEFFGISPREACAMDPQERLFLEIAWQTIEDAGYCPKELDDQDQDRLCRVGVFVGAMWSEYQLYNSDEHRADLSILPESSFWSIPNRVSYIFNFHGPSLAVDSACSSALTAIHQACESLQKKECSTALAGGVSLSLHPQKYVSLSQKQFLSREGKCRSFGKGGDGFVSGEGIGAVLLKPLNSAIEAGDHIYGIIKGIAVNHGGKTNGYTVPNPKAQADVIFRAYENAGIDPRNVSYLETHGTGTSLGDPVEIEGLSKIFPYDSDDEKICAIGSVKSNIGHCESAAGIAGLTKVLLQLKYKKLVPSLYSETINPNIDFSRTPFRIQQEIEKWKPAVDKDGNQYPRIAGISSFGAGGTNAHVVIGEYIPKESEKNHVISTGSHPCIIVLSAKNRERLKTIVENLLKLILDQDQAPENFWENNLVNMAYTLQVGREPMNSRLAMIVESFADLKEKLKVYLEERKGIENLFRGEMTQSKNKFAVFETDDDLKDVIDLWIDKGKYRKLLDLWVDGFDFDWNRLYPGIKPQRISLPAYPFKGDRYWFKDLAGTNIPDNRRVSSEVPKVTTSKSAENKDQISLQPLSLITDLSMEKPDSNEYRVNLSTLEGDIVNHPESEPLKFNQSVSFKTLHAELTVSLADVLFMKPEEIDADRQFVDMGLDSIVGVEWIKNINKKYGTCLSAPMVYDYPNLRKFAEFLSKEFKKDEKAKGGIDLNQNRFGKVETILQEVQQGSLNVDLADELLKSISLKGEG